MKTSFRAKAYACAMLGSSALLPAAALAQPQNADLPQVFTMSPTGVNLQTGKYDPEFTDLHPLRGALQPADIGLHAKRH